MKSAIRGFFIACVLLLVAAVMPPTIQGVVIASASAGTYEDNVFRRGEPRAGDKPWLYEDRNLRYRRGAQWGGHRAVHGRSTHSREVAVYRYRRLIAVRRVARPAPVMQAQPRARCGGRCVTARPTYSRSKPKCSTCGASATRQNNTAKVSGIKSVVKGDGNTVTQTVTVNQTNVYGGGAAAAGSAIKEKFGAYVRMGGTPRAKSAIPCKANGLPGFRGVDENGRHGCVH